MAIATVETEAIHSSQILRAAQQERGGDGASVGRGHQPTDRLAHHRSVVIRREALRIRQAPRNASSHSWTAA